MIINYNSTDEIVRNPERGFYRHQDEEWASGNLVIDFGKYKACYDAGYTLAFLYCGLDQYDPSHNQPISSTQIERLRTHLETFQAVGMKCILRFTFTNDVTFVSNTAVPPFNDHDLDVIEAHLDQLQSEIFAHPSSNAIAVVQAGFIGAWGEWHYTAHFADANGDRDVKDLDAAVLAKRKLVLDKLLDVVPEHLMVQMRYAPERYRLFPTELTSAVQNVPQTRVGIHDDAFLNSDGNLGTFRGDQLRTEEQYRAYSENESRFVVFGGEMNNEIGNANRTPERAKAELIRNRYSFFNWDFNRDTLLEWERLGQVVSEMKRYLGYRLVLVQSDLPESVQIGSSFSGSIRIRNDGWGSVYNQKRVKLVFKNQNLEAETELPIDLRELLPGTLPNDQDNEKLFEFNVSLPATLLAGDYSLSLKIMDLNLDAKAFCILTANQHTWDSSDGMNSLVHSIEIEP